MADTKPKELSYIVLDGYYFSGNTISINNTACSYAVQVVRGSTYTVTLIEIGDRLRALCSKTDPTTITATTSVEGEVISVASDFYVGYTFDYTATFDGWLMLYVSSNGEKPKISIVTDGVGGDGAMDTPEEPTEEVYYKISGERLTAIADQVRRLTGTTDSFNPEQMETNLESVVIPEELMDAEEAAFGIVVDDVVETGISSLSNIDYDSSYYYMCAINKYKANEPITIVGLRMYNYIAGGTMSLRLWNEKGETIRETEQTSYPYGTWTTVYFDKPVDIALGESFYVNTSSIRNMAYCRLSNVTFNSKVTFEGSTQGGDSVPSTISQHSVYGIVDFIIGESSGELPDSYEIQRTTMDDIAEEVQRITGATTKLNTAQILTALQGIQLQSKAVTPTDTEQTITPDEGYYGLSSVVVGASAGEVLEGLSEVAF